MHMYVYVCMYVCIYIYIYIFIEREREREIPTEVRDSAIGQICGGSRGRERKRSQSYVGRLSCGYARFPY